MIIKAPARSFDGRGFIFAFCSQHRNMKIPVFICCGLLFVVLVKAQVIEVSAGAHTRNQVPLRVTLNKRLLANTQYQLVNEKTGAKGPAQLIDSNTLAFVLPEKLLSGQTVQYELQPVPANTFKNAVTIEREPAGLMVMVKDQPLLFYHTQTVNPPADSPAYYARSGFIHPLFTPRGKILTDDFPAGHAHQHALFASWSNTTFKNEFVDFWNQHQKKGTVEHLEVEKITDGPVMAQLQLLLSYKSFAHGEVLQETWTLEFYPFTDNYMFDLRLEQVNNTQDTLYLNQYHYGGLAFRGSRQWNPHDKIYYKNNWNIITSEGIKDSAANATHARWVDAFGLIDGAVAGAAVFNHPANFRYPQAIRVHPSMPYWAFAPVVDGAFTINPGETYRAQFRYYIHDGPVDRFMLEAIEKDWIEPPQVKVVK
jgi:hypothetical protein